MNIKAYDTEEAGGVVWIYMGPKEKKPALPRMEWMELPPDHVHISRWLQRSNWLQALEGELDSSHISFLHVSDSSAGADLNRGFNYAARDGRPTIFIKETDYGFFYAARRSFEDIYYWRVSHFMQPVWSSVAPASPENYYCNGRGASPVDDYSTVTFSYRYRVDRPLDETDIEEVTSGRWFPPEVRRGTLQMPNGYVIDTFLPTAIKGNDYKIDRELQRDGSFTGIFGINTQDRAIQETMPAVHGELPGLVDRSNEHLVASDAPVAAFRRQLVKLATDLRKGIEPTAALNPESYLARGLVKFSPIADFAAFLAENSAVIQGLAMPDSAIPAQQDTIRMEQMAQVE
jgi:phenylpropionate dioxygenase-like ring-hydroxylating dioxygenase large terminal subunit